MKKKGSAQLSECMQNSCLIIHCLEIALETF